jgi:hypothetical protein
MLKSCCCVLPLWFSQQLLKKTNDEKEKEMGLYLRLFAGIRLGCSIWPVLGMEVLWPS